MKRWMHKLELFIDRVIPYCLVLLIIIIVLELGFHKFVEEHGLLLTINILDYLIILIFILDLIFKYVRVRDIPKFLKLYWLEILAVFPFFLIFRLAELAFGVSEVSSGIKTAQSLTHSTVELEKEVAVLREGEGVLKEGEKLLKEGEKVLKAERSVRLSRFLRPLLRIPRFFKTIPSMLHFYDTPTGDHHNADIKIDKKI
ncbi:MAG: hypothetical protein ACP5NW_02630 [Candidatus Woesearchaeota archaeon]